MRLLCMIIDKNNEAARHDALMEAFKDPEFQNKLDLVKSELEVWLGEWAGQLPPFDLRIDNVASVESRVKGEKTFEEKLYRKDYIKEWEVTDDKIANQALIMRSLTDLIGLRVNCHFFDHELAFYNFFYHTKGNQTEKGFEFNFDEDTNQKNGNKIYKFSGLYKGTYHFEVQIKSIVHNVWGEIEHRTVYKNPTYDGFFEEKKRISKTLHDAMMASDKELHILFNMKESEEQLLKSLFFCKTCNEVAAACKTHVLGEHYNTYFMSFKDIEPIKKYLVCNLSGVKFERMEVKTEADDFYKTLSEAVKNTFPSFFIECLFHIDALLHIHSSYDSFLLYFLQNVIKKEDDDFDEDYSRAFSTEETPPADKKEIIKDYLIEIDSLLGTKVFKNETNNKINEYN